MLYPSHIPAVRSLRPQQDKGGLPEPGVRQHEFAKESEKTRKPDVIFLISNDRATALWVARRLINEGETTFSQQLIGGAKGLAHMPNIEYVREAGSEGIEIMMRLIARGDVMADIVGGRRPKVTHRFYHMPASNNAVGPSFWRRGIKHALPRIIE